MAKNTTPTPAYALPRVTIQFCTQCKWLLRAAYYAQELLSTFSTALGEVALQPATGGVFVVEIVYEVAQSQNQDEDQSEDVGVNSHVLWDRKVDGGFPETKELKRRVRDVIEPGRNLGHVDQNYGQSKGKKDERDRAEAPGEGEASRAVGTTKETTTHAIKVAESHGGKNCSAEAGKCEDCE